MKIRETNDKVFAFSNENLTSFEKLYHFDNADVLSVLGSGDQYFAAKLFGARNVDLFDNNPATYFHFIIKFTAIQILPYEDFYFLFIKNRLNDAFRLKKILPYLPKDVASNLLEFLKSHKRISDSLMYSAISDHVLNYQTGRIIPYFDPENYRKLQKILQNSPIPRIIIGDFWQLPNQIPTDYDILLASNIFTWRSCSLKEYQEFLRKFNIPEIEALYSWNKNSVEQMLEEKSDFILDQVESVSLEKEDPHDYILSLRK